MHNMPDITQFQIADHSITTLVQSAKLDEAAARAQELLSEKLRHHDSCNADDQPNALSEVAETLSDLGCVIGLQNDPARAIKPLEKAMELAPNKARLFHNMTALLCKFRQLRGKNYNAILDRLTAVQSEAEWAKDYQPLFWMPTFLNLEFVEGKCNLKCRMCIGTNAATHPNKFRSISVDEFRNALEAAPTISGVTLSSGDSEPLLHPQFTDIIDVAQDLGVAIDIFTNGLPLIERTCKRIVESQAVNMINFSLDAATTETYERIRGGNFERLHKNIRMLRDMKEQHDKALPIISLSFVAMADNIQELPKFVEIAKEYNAQRIFVEDLLGWLGESNGNQPAIDNPRCHEYVREAMTLANNAGIFLQLPERLRNINPQDPAEPETQQSNTDSSPDSVNDTGDASPSDHPDQSHSPARLASEHRCCTWLNGTWVNGNGTLQPCCMLHNVADMGNMNDGALYHNQKFNRVKSLLNEGKVFAGCADKKCEFVQQELARSRPLRMITTDELGDLDRSVPVGSNADNASEDALLSLPVLESA